jgi:hypothetical protein
LRTGSGAEAVDDVKEDLGLQRELEYVDGIGLVGITCSQVVDAESGVA